MVASAVPSASAPSVASSVKIGTVPQLGPYTPSSGSAHVPEVGRTPVDGEHAPQPTMGHSYGTGSELQQGSAGAPSVPVDGFLFTPGVIDAHYRSEYEVKDPYKKVNNPPTRGMNTWVQGYENNAALAPQDVDGNAFRTRPGQQRTSWMRFQPPPSGGGYAPETFVPAQQPQAVRYNRIQGQIGTQAYGTGVLNSDTRGAGQTAGGIGGSNYTPAPGPPGTNSTAGNGNDATGMPVWG